MTFSARSHPSIQQTFAQIIQQTLLVVGMFIILIIPAQAQEFTAARDVTAQDAFSAMHEETLVLIDIRTPEEWAQTGMAQGAHPISMLDQQFITKLETLQNDNPGKAVAFICASGNRSVVVQEELARRGYENMFSVYGGTTGSRLALGWIREGLPIEPWSAN